MSFGRTHQITDIVLRSSYGLSLQKRRWQQVVNKVPLLNLDLFTGYGEFFSAASQNNFPYSSSDFPIRYEWP